MRKKSPLFVGLAVAATILMAPLSALAQNVLGPPPQPGPPPIPGTLPIPAGPDTRPPIVVGTPVMPGTTDALSSGAAAPNRPMPAPSSPTALPTVTPSPLPTLRPQLLPSPGSIPGTTPTSQIQLNEPRQSRVSTLQTSEGSPGGNGAKGPFPLNAGSTMGIEVRKQ